jgi:hypothetical protein
LIVDAVVARIGFLATGIGMATGSAVTAAVIGRVAEAHLLMAASDLDIARTAHLWIQQHGDAATAKAREMVDKMRRRGDTEGADTWLRIIVAIGTLGTPPTNARH